MSILQLLQGNAPIVDAQPMATAPLRASIIPAAAEIGAFALDLDGGRVVQAGTDSPNR